MKPILRYLFVVFGCLHMVCGPYALMQAYAWANMIIDYSKETGLSQAVTDTFSGEKPCCLCKQIAAAKAAESENNQQNTPVSPLGSKSIEHLLLSTIITIRDPKHTDFLPSGFGPVGQPISPHTSGPPLPPPEC